MIIVFKKSNFDIVKSSVLDLRSFSNIIVYHHKPVHPVCKKNVIDAVLIRFKICTKHGAHSFRIRSSNSNSGGHFLYK